MNFDDFSVDFAPTGDDCLRPSFHHIYSQIIEVFFVEISLGYFIVDLQYSIASVNLQFFFPFENSLLEDKFQIDLPRLILIVALCPLWSFVSMYKVIPMQIELKKDSYRLLLDDIWLV